MGRFLQRDPIGYLGGINLYTYAGNNSVNFVDPLGLWWNWEGAGEGLVNVGIGLAVGAAVVGGVVVLLPAAVATGVLTGLGVLGAASLGLTTGQVITGRTLLGKKICDKERSKMAVGALAGWLGLWIAATNTPYLRYTGSESKPAYNSTGEVLNKTWLTRSYLPFSNKSPYSISQAGSKLQIPNEVTNVEQVNVPLGRYVVGPRPVWPWKHPEWGSGWGTEYRVGGWYGE
ncbi:MAG: RHS repeat-associated core domain-containing protein [Planctomycetes bacterium]|nr:RHS repeat-associated core domain-containing protein [Planctomycetota bacterium]